MSTTADQLPTNEVDYVKVVRMQTQRFIEVESSFPLRHRGQLRRYWNIKKDDTDVHQLRYNNQTENPLLGCQGWNEFKDHHDLPDNVIVTFTYHGNNFFEVSGIEEIVCASQLPPFHSRCLDPTKTTVFDIELTPPQINVPKLKIDHDFATFLHDSSLDFFYLCGDNGYRFPITVRNPTNVSKMKLTNWEMVCEYLQFKSGDIIRFKFEADLTFVSERCHIMKLN
ncbi:hypothetical protein P8452_76192 [Trifolium repens]|nr:hypothetical protein P8452_76192 [Trifolium repens]